MQDCCFLMGGIRAFPTSDALLETACTRSARRYCLGTCYESEAQNGKQLTVLSPWQGRPAKHGQPLSSNRRDIPGKRMEVALWE